jgi:L-ascorbate metabolism protein UlaG (beta-lactamase superfamily)
VIEPLLKDDALLADIDAARRECPRALHVWWLGQSGFLCTQGGASILFDPYLSDSLTAKYANTDKPHVRMSRRVIDPSCLRQIDFVTSTHMHTDHADASTLQSIAFANEEASQKTPVLVVPEANLHSLIDRAQGGNWLAFLTVVEERWWHGDNCDFVAVAAAHPELTRNADGFPIYVGFVARIGPFTIYHAGDGVVYDGLADAVRRHGPIDLAILPINGKVGNMNGTDAARLAKAIGAKLVVPCHYHMFEFNTAEPEELFVPECERIGQPYRVLKLGERLTLEATT